MHIPVLCIYFCCCYLFICADNFDKMRFKMLKINCLIDCLMKDRISVQCL